MQDLQSEDQPLFYLGMDEEKDAGLRKVLTRPWRNSANMKKEWLHAVTEIVPVVLGGGYDESRYHAITRFPNHLELLEKPI